MKKLKIEGFHLVEGSIGIILDSIWVKDDGSEIIIKPATGGRWTFGALEKGQKSSLDSNLDNKYTDGKLDMSFMDGRNSLRQELREKIK